jgi:hypothetical protein
MRSSIITPLLAAARAITTEEISLPHIQSTPHEITLFDSGQYGPYPNRTYITDSTVISPQLNILQQDERCNDGLYTMISLRGDKVALKGQSPMIHDHNGNLVWMNATYGETFGLTVQKYKGQDYLTFWQGDDSVGGHGEGYYFMVRVFKIRNQSKFICSKLTDASQLDSSYKEVYKLTAGNGLPGDLHEFKITPEGTALLTQYKFEEAEFGGGRQQNRKGYIWDSVIQEVNIETNEVIFEWHASEHYDINESDFPSGNTGRNQHSGYDFFHINSIDKDNLGNYLVSSRYYQSLTYIDGKDGSILWTLGGKKNSFRDLSDGKATTFGWQHDARWNADHTGITLFDNGARYGLRPQVEYSRGVEIALDLVAMTAQLKTEFVNPRKIISASQGSMQILPSGNVLLGYGYNAAWTEFLPTGEAICDVHVGSQKTFNTGAVQTYHVSKQAWTGFPTTDPLIVWDSSEGGSVYLSWNGATEIQNWVLQASGTKEMEHTSILDIAMVPKTGFETKARVDCRKWPFVRAVAVDGKGQKLGTSVVLETICSELPEEAGESKAMADLWMGLGLFVITTSGVLIAWTWRWWARRREYRVVSQKMWEE